MEECRSTITCSNELCWVLHVCAVTTSAAYHDIYLYCIMCQYFQNFLNTTNCQVEKKITGPNQFIGNFLDLLLSVTLTRYYTMSNEDRQVPPVQTLLCHLWVYVVCAPCVHYGAPLKIRNAACVTIVTVYSYC